MAARAKRKGTGSAGAFAGTVLRLTLPLLVGVAAGYVWRSYYPLALPVESKLVSDATSSDLDGTGLRSLAAAAERRAEKAERERQQLAERVQELEQHQQRTERELGDLQIKSVLQTSAQ